MIKRFKKLRLECMSPLSLGSMQLGIISKTHSPILLQVLQSTHPLPMFAFLFLPDKAGDKAICTVKNAFSSSALSSQLGKIRRKNGS